MQRIAGSWPEDRLQAGRIIAGPWLDAPPFEREWASRAEVGDCLFVSGHTSIERIW